VELGERVEDTVKREAKEETGLSVNDLSLLGVFDIMSRDPVGVVRHYISVCYRADRVEGVLRAGSDVLEAGWFLPTDLTEGVLTETTFRILKEAKIL
jgi:8-oxo-dGTP diphosphatase